LWYYYINRGIATYNTIIINYDLSSFVDYNFSFSLFGGKDYEWLVHSKLGNVSATRVFWGKCVNAMSWNHCLESNH